MIMKIMATFDRSEYGEAILPALQQIAALPNAKFVLLAVAESPSGRRRRGRTPIAAVSAAFGGDIVIVKPQPERLVETKSQAIARQVSALEDYLRDLAKQLPEGSSYSIEAHVAEHPANVIIERARQEAPAVIVMATHGHTGLVRSLFGSVTDDVVRSGVAPVLVVHPRT
ncbi:MAG: universal stress protein [Dehalococcoidia bacterium]|nr:MAG: universal stress protein [Dehalococcoidia bacterium]